MQVRITDLDECDSFLLHAGNLRYAGDHGMQEAQPGHSHDILPEACSPAQALGRVLEAAGESRTR